MADGDGSGYLQGHPIQTGNDTTHSGTSGSGTSGTNQTGGDTTGSDGNGTNGTATGLKPLPAPLRTLSPIPVGQLSDELLMPTGARFGIKESWSVLAPAGIYRSWTGAAIVIQNPYHKRHAVKWQGSGKAIREMPCLDVMESGDLAVLECLTRQQAAIYPGDTSTTLWFDPVPNSIRLHTSVTGQRVPFYRQGRVISLAADPDGDIVTVSYRPRLPVVVRTWTTSYDMLTGLLTYDLGFEEQ